MGPASPPLWAPALFDVLDNSFLVFFFCMFVFWAGFVGWLWVEVLRLVTLCSCISIGQLHQAVDN